VKPDSVRARHMLDAAREILEFTSTTTRRDLDEDRKLGLAVVHLFEIIGEAAAGVTDDFRTANPSIPWSSIIGMRNRLIHGYHDIDLDIVWETVQRDLPALVSSLEDVIDSDN